jgi:hypothetical protein
MSLLNDITKDLNPSTIDRSAMVRDLRSASTLSDAVALEAIDTITTHPDLKHTRGLPDALAHLVEGARPSLSEAACRGLSNIFKPRDDLPDLTRKRAGRIARTLTAAPGVDRASWAGVSLDLDLCLELVEHATPVTLAPVLTLAFDDLDAPEHAAFVEALLERAPTPVRLAMLSRFGEGTDPRWVLTLAKTTEGADSKYLDALAHALGRIRHVAAEPVLLSILLEHSQSEDEELAALSVLQSLGTPQSLPHLETLRLFASTQPELRQAIDVTTERITERATSARRSGALTLATSHTTDGALSIAGATEGDLALYHATASLSSIHTSEAAVSITTPRDMNQISIPWLFWGLWPFARSPAFLIIVCVYVLMFGFIMGMPIFILGMTRWYGEVEFAPLYFYFPLMTVLIAWNTQEVRKWRRDRKFQCLRHGTLTEATVVVSDALRLNRTNNRHALVITWTTPDGRTHTTQRPSDHTFLSYGQGTNTDISSCQVAHIEGHAVVLGLDVPFTVDDENRLRLDNDLFLFLVLFTPAFVFFNFAALAVLLNAL